MPQAYLVSLLIRYPQGIADLFHTVFSISLMTSLPSIEVEWGKNEGEGGGGWLPLITHCFPSIRFPPLPYTSPKGIRGSSKHSCETSNPHNADGSLPLTGNTFPLESAPIGERKGRGQNQKEGEGRTVSRAFQFFLSTPVNST